MFHTVCARALFELFWIYRSAEETYMYYMIWSHLNSRAYFTSTVYAHCNSINCAHKSCVSRIIYHIIMTIVLNDDSLHCIVQHYNIIIIVLHIVFSGLRLRIRAPPRCLPTLLWAEYTYYTEYTFQKSNYRKYKFVKCCKHFYEAKTGLRTF